MYGYLSMAILPSSFYAYLYGYGFQSLWSHMVFPTVVLVLVVVQ